MTWTVLGLTFLHFYGVLASQCTDMPSQSKALEFRLEAQPLVVLKKPDRKEQPVQVFFLRYRTEYSAVCNLQSLVIRRAPYLRPRRHTSGNSDLQLYMRQLQRHGIFILESLGI